MRHLTKVDVILHKVGINTNCYKYWQLPRAEMVIINLQYNKSIAKYRRKCIVKYPEVLYDFTDEYDRRINQGMCPYDAWHEVMKVFVWK